MHKFLSEKKILLGITGGIAAYKICNLIRELRENGCEVKAILTDGAKDFITPTTINALTGDANIYDSMSHITLARWADIVMIAPASANFIARVSNGLADDLLTTICLATESPILVAPAMNQQMWHNQATQHNIEILQQRDIKILGPNSGIQACGEVGLGRMLEPEELLSAINQHFAPKILNNTHILITAGPTHESIDPVRYISNRSSGKMGYALATAALQLGATVTLISGPTQINRPKHNMLKFIAVKTAEQMLNAVSKAIHFPSNVDIFIGCAAVADYRPKVLHPEKIKKQQISLDIELERTPDILASVANLPPTTRPLTIGFAAETENLLENAHIKLKSKGLDMIIANNVAADKAFNTDNNAVTIINKDGGIEEFSLRDKQDLAVDILESIHDLYSEETVNI